MSTPKFIIKRGPKEKITPQTLAPGELGFSTDTDELIVGTSDGLTKVVTVVVAGPSGGLYIEDPKGYLPLCIGDTVIKKSVTKKEPYEDARSVIQWPANTTVMIGDLISFERRDGKSAKLQLYHLYFVGQSPEEVQETITKTTVKMQRLYRIDNFYAGGTDIYYKDGIWLAAVFIVGRTADEEHVVFVGENGHLFMERLVFE